MKRLRIDHLVSQVHIPVEASYQMRDGKNVAKERNSYAGYVLLEVALDGEIEHIIKAVPRVVGFLGDKSSVATPHRPAEVHRILGKVDEMARQAEMISVPFYAGETVKVNDGPFNGFTGEI